MKLHLLLTAALCVSSSVCAMEVPKGASLVSPIFKCLRYRNSVTAAKAITALCEQGVTQYVYDSLGIVEYIDYKGAAVANIKDGSGRTPLHYAIYRNSRSAFGALVNAGADLEAVDSNGHTPAQCAALQARARILGFLFQHKARHAVTPDGKTLLHLAAISNTKETLATIEYLAKCGMAVNAPDKAGNTPLHDALRAKASAGIIIRLIALGADVDIKDSTNVTARTLLKKIGFEIA